MLLQKRSLKLDGHWTTQTFQNAASRETRSIVFLTQTMDGKSPS